MAAEQAVREEPPPPVPGCMREGALGVPRSLRELAPAAGMEEACLRGGASRGVRPGAQRPLLLLLLLPPTQVLGLMVGASILSPAPGPVQARGCTPLSCAASRRVRVQLEWEWAHAQGL